MFTTPAIPLTSCQVKRLCQRRANAIPHVSARPVSPNSRYSSLPFLCHHTIPAGIPTVASSSRQPPPTILLPITQLYVSALESSMSGRYPYAYSMAAPVSPPTISSDLVPRIETRIDQGDSLSLAQFEQGLEAAVPSQAGLEPTPQNYPELARRPQYHHPGYTHDHGFGQPSTYTDTKPAPSPSIGNSDISPNPYASARLSLRTKGPKTVCGCGLLTFILSCIIALLSVSAIGLAAGTGIEARRANDVAEQLAALNASIARMTVNVTSGGASAGPAVTLIDDGCEVDPEGVTETTYSAFPLIGAQTFTRYCNKDAKFEPVMKMFAASFSMCMDACASYTKYVSLNFGRDGSTTCWGVSFVPAWTNKTVASQANAPGNCYLKPGPQNITTLQRPTNGLAVHAGIWTPEA